jgi:hypothetical protein
MARHSAPKGDFFLSANTPRTVGVRERRSRPNPIELYSSVGARGRCNLPRISLLLAAVGQKGVIWRAFALQASRTVELKRAYS